MSQPSTSSDYSVFALIVFLWKRRVVLCLVPILVMFLAAMWTLSIDNTYLSEATLAPAEEANANGMSPLSSQLGGLASLAGLSVQGGSVDKVTEALAILKSRYFTLKFIKKHELEIPLIASEYWDESSGKLVINPKIYDVDSETWTRDVQEGRSPEPTSHELYERWLELFLVEKDATSGLVNISIEFLSPNLARDWLTLLLIDINEEMRQREIEEAKSNIDYLEKQVEAIENIDMRNVFYQLILEQTQSLMLAEVREEFMFKVIDPPVVPEKRYAPNRTLICLVVGLLTGFFLLCVYSMKFLVVPRI